MHSGHDMRVSRISSAERNPGSSPSPMRVSCVTGPPSSSLSCASTIVLAAIPAAAPSVPVPAPVTQLRDRVGDQRAHPGHGSRDGGRDGEQGRARHRVEQGVHRVLHEHLTTGPRHQRRSDGTVVEQPRQHDRRGPRAGPARRAGEHHVDRRPVAVHPWPVAEPGHAARGEQVEIRWCHVDVARTQRLAVAGVRGGQRPRPREDPGQVAAGVAPDVHRHEHAGGQVRRQGRDELDQRLDPAGRAADRQYGTVSAHDEAFPDPAGTILDVAGDGLIVV